MSTTTTGKTLCEVFARESQGSLFTEPRKTLAQARTERDQAMSEVEEHAGEDWQEYALAVIRMLAQRSGLLGFSSDDVMYTVRWKPHDSRALGPAMKAAQKLGYILPTDNFRPSTRRHATPLRVWMPGPNA